MEVATIEVDRDEARKRVEEFTAKRRRARRSATAGTNSTSDLRCGSTMGFKRTGEAYLREFSALTSGETGTEN